MPDRQKQIIKWLGQIKRSKLSAPMFFDQYNVPFSLSQFYRYKKALDAGSLEELADGRAGGNNRRIHSEAEGFLVGYVEAHDQMETRT